MAEHDIHQYWEKALHLYSNGDIDGAMDICKQEPCASDSVECQKFLGWRFYEKDLFDDALYWFFKAKAIGDAESIFGIASVHYTRYEYEDALNEYIEALHNGNFRACFWIGYMYQYGLGAKRDINKALDYYRIGSKNGYLMSERALIHLIFKQGSFIEKVKKIPSFIFIVIKSLFIANSDIQDERLADIPNAFNSKR